MSLSVRLLLCLDRSTRLLFLVIAGTLAVPASLAAAEPPRKLVLVAGRPSHPPRMHEFNAGVQLLQKCLHGSPLVETQVVLNGWPADEKIFENAHAIVFYMDGGGGHELVKENGRRLKLAEEWAARGVGLGCMHYGVEVVADQAGQQFKKWIGGHYEHMFSCNPIWEPEFSSFPDHPVSRGVKPFRIRDEWYFHMRFVGDLPGHRREQVGEVRFQPILVASPPDAVRDGPYVYPAGPYPHIQANKGRAEAMLWCVERPDHGRGFGFTGGHFHDNWSNDQFRKVVLNALVWLTGAEVPPGGVHSHITPADLEAHLDPKQK